MTDTLDEDIPKTPMEPIRVARRSLVLSVVVCRGSIDKGEGNPEIEALPDRILAWLTQLDLWDEVEPSEETILRTPLGELELKDVIRATWDVEGLAVLAWALKQQEFPVHDQKVDPIDVADSVWCLDEDAEDLIRTATLRVPTELHVCGEFLYAIHARLRDFIRHRDRKNFTRWVEKEWIDALGLDASSLIVDNDLAIDGKAISKVDYDRVQECANITLQRHKAINWLLGGDSLYSETYVYT